MAKIVLGLNAFHADSAAAIAVDGALIAAAEEERFRRIKHWSGFPSQAIAYCLQEAGVGLQDVDAIALNTDPKAGRAQRLLYAIKKRPSLGLIVEKIKTRAARMGVQEHLHAAFPAHQFKGQIIAIEHHLAHLASAYYCSPFSEALAVSIDGFGDFASGAYGLGRGDSLNIDGHVYFPHSLGIFYQAMTQYLGFSNYGDEYKVMGLAPYGKPSRVEQLRQLLGSKADGSYELNLKYFRHHTDSLNYQWENGSPQFDSLFAETLTELLGPPRIAGSELTNEHKDLATSVQAIYEESAFALLNGLHKKYPVDALTLAGGCAQNSVANGKITRSTPFKQVYIAASGADAGGAVGAALAASIQLGCKRTAPMTHGYWGNAFDRGACEAAVSARQAEIDAQGIRVSKALAPAELCERVVARVVQGHVIGWFQGRMEWGPRALGNRSILADPRRSDIKDILNLKIKRRESFRPFAPSILREHVADWFEVDADVPFMSLVFPIRQARRAQIPAVTHVDGSGRLQTVSASDNPLYYQLIETFHRASGVPILLNTSFNENEPVVCRPEEALDCFMRTKMDVLALGDCLLERAS
jgi:carbamoyltransferase